MHGCNIAICTWKPLKYSSISVILFCHYFNTLIYWEPWKQKQKSNPSLLQPLGPWSDTAAALETSGCTFMQKEMSGTDVCAVSLREILEGVYLTYLLKRRHYLWFLKHLYLKNRKSWYLMDYILSIGMKVIPHSYIMMPLVLQLWVCPLSCRQARSLLSWAHHSRPKAGPATPCMTETTCINRRALSTSSTLSLATRFPVYSEICKVLWHTG